MKVNLELGVITARGRARCNEIKVACFYSSPCIKTMKLKH